MGTREALEMIARRCRRSLPADFRYGEIVLWRLTNALDDALDIPNLAHTEASRCGLASFCDYRACKGILTHVDESANHSIHRQLTWS